MLTKARLHNVPLSHVSVPGTSSPKWNAAIINTANPRCAFPALTSQNVCRVSCAECSVHIFDTEVQHESPENHAGFNPLTQLMI